MEGLKLVGSGRSILSTLLYFNKRRLLLLCNLERSFADTLPPHGQHFVSAIDYDSFLMYLPAVPDDDFGWC